MLQVMSDTRSIFYLKNVIVKYNINYYHTKIQVTRTFWYKRLHFVKTEKTLTQLITLMIWKLLHDAAQCVLLEMLDRQNKSAWFNVTLFTWNARWYYMIFTWQSKHHKITWYGALGDFVSFWITFKTQCQCCCPNLLELLCVTWFFKNLSTTLTETVSSFQILQYIQRYTRNCSA